MEGACKKKNEELAIRLGIGLADEKKFQTSKALLKLLLYYQLLKPISTHAVQLWGTRLLLNIL